jgi:hypothetical protein
VDLFSRYSDKATGWTTEVPFAAGARDFTLHSVQTDFRAHPASYSLGTGAVSPGVKLLAPEADHSPPSSVDVKMVELYIHCPIRLHMITRFHAKSKIPRSETPTPPVWIYLVCDVMSYEYMCPAFSPQSKLTIRVFSTI